MLRESNASINRGTMDESRRPQPQEQMYCVEHPDELVNYYCFQCNCSNICAECVIHGTHKNHDVQTIKKAYPTVCAKLEDLKSSVNSKIEDLINAQHKLDGGKKDIHDQVNSVKKRISDAFTDLRDNIDRKEQELLREADDFSDQNVKQIDHLLRLANGRAMNLSEHTQAIKEALNMYDHHSACEFYCKNYQQIKESNTSDLPQLDQIAGQTHKRFQISVHNINDILEGLHNYKLNIASLHLDINQPLDNSQSQQRREERGKGTNGGLNSQSPYDLGYKNSSGLKSSVAKTMNKIKQNLVVSERPQQQYYDYKASKGSAYKNPAMSQGYYNSRVYDEEDDEEDYMFMNR